MGGVFLIGDDGQLVEMAEQDPPSESLLQELLAKYPNLLAGDQIDSDEPRRWLLISRHPCHPRSKGRMLQPLPHLDLNPLEVLDHEGVSFELLHLLPGP